MRSSLPALLTLILIAGLTHATPTLSLSTSSTATLALLSGATAPIQLTAIAPSVTIGANATQLAASAVSAGIAVPTSTNLTAAADTTASDLRIRLSHISTSGTGVSECVSCKLQLVCGGTTSDQIVITLGAVANATGSYQTAGAAGTNCATWYIWSVAQGTLVADKTATLNFDLDVQPSGSSFPNATYVSLSVSWTV
ncbi:MAG: hypothetical protein WDA16_11790 [Candidatus Thermoplasmatota archaeon]